MPNDVPPGPGPRPEGFRTRLAHVGRAGTHVRGFVNPPLHRGSTVLYPNVAERLGRKGSGDRQLLYGLTGTPTHWALEDAVAEIEGGTHCQIVSSGLAAITIPLLAFLKSGEHLLVPDSCYGPTRNFCDQYLGPHVGVETTYYDPQIDEAGIAALMRPNTTVVFTESPGSHTFEVQDIAAIARAAHAGGATVMMDNTWGIGFFQPFRHGVDVSIQALTKYVGGHSDLVIGGVSVNNDETWRRLRSTALLLGDHPSPDDCWLALRGVRTLGVRMEAQMAAGMRVAEWLRARPEVQEVLHPALPGARGHDLWKRDFTGACSLFGVVFRPDYDLRAVHAMIDSLELFGIGASWGGFESLVLPTTAAIRRTAGTGEFGGPAIRLHVGLEDTADLIADLERGLAVLRSGGSEGESDVGDPGS
jgi:cysteine-S-conjugate beta-lyase